VLTKVYKIYNSYVLCVFFFNISERTKVTRKTRTKHEAETEGLKRPTFIYLFNYFNSFKVCYFMMQPVGKVIYHW